MRIKRDKRLAVEEHNARAIQEAAVRRAAFKGEPPAVIAARERRAAKVQKEERENRRIERKQTAASWLVSHLSRSRPTREGVTAAIGAVEIPVGVLNLFRVPFWHDSMGYIRDGSNNVAVSYSPPIARGWGRIQNLPNGAELFDRWGEIYKAIAGTETDLDVIARLLTEHWAAAFVSLLESTVTVPPGESEALRESYIADLLKGFAMVAPSEHLPTEESDHAT